METSTGVVRLVDFMPIRDERPDIVRIIEGVEGTVDMHVDLVVRFDMGRVVPWARQREDALVMTAGPDALCLRGDVEVHGEELATVGDFTVRAGDRRSMVLTWFPSHLDLPAGLDPTAALRETEEWWRDWSANCKYEGPWPEAVMTSLRVLKALTYGPTGGIVAAPTTSLPEWPGGARNWDYRYCWLRDATLTLYALMLGGHEDEAKAWREWLLRAAAGDAGSLQIMYGVAGERRLTEYEAPWLAGFEGSLPVRIGNAAHQQMQLDVFGEVMDALFQARRLGMPPNPLVVAPGAQAPRIFRTALEGARPRHLGGPGAEATLYPLEGDGLGGLRPGDQIGRMIWPRRTGRSLAQPAGRDSRGRLRARIRSKARDVHAELRRSGGGRVVASHAPGRFLAGERSADQENRPNDRARAPGRRPRPSIPDRHGQRRRRPQPGEGVFLPCSFWLVDVYVQLGWRAEACALFERLLGLCNDVGLLSEEYDPTTKRLLGNFPQAFSHLSLVNTAYNLTVHPSRPVSHRSEKPPVLPRG